MSSTRHLGEALRSRTTTRYSQSRRLGIAGVLFLVVGVTSGVGDRDDWLIAFDQDVVDRIRWEGSTEVLEIVSLLGSTELSLIVLGVVTLALGPPRRKMAAWYAAAVAAGLFANVLLKEIVSRPRPLGAATTTSLDSFPSGHMIQVTLLAMLVPVIVRAVSHRTRLGDVASVVLSAAVVAVGLARLFLGAHWPSDILAGVYIGVLVALLVGPQLARASPKTFTPSG